MRKIKLTQEDIDRMVEEFSKTLADTRFDTNKINYSADIKVTEETPKAKVYFTPETYCKMTTLVKSCQKEIAWHGIIERNEEGAYIIKDIMMYPQEITGATVTSNDEKYPMWLMKQPDEIFNNLRFQGHSHVNFGATPSSTDLALYSTMLQELSEDDFYIFYIQNKSNEFWIQIYNLAENIIYEKGDIDVAILFSDGTTATDWYANQSSENIIEKQTTIGRSVKTSKAMDSTWRWDVTRGVYVPLGATEKEIRNCFTKAKKKSKGKADYDKYAAEELMQLHDEIQMYATESPLNQMMLDDDLIKKDTSDRVTAALLRENYYGGY